MKALTPIPLLIISVFYLSFFSQTGDSVARLIDRAVQSKEHLPTFRVGTQVKSNLGKAIKNGEKAGSKNRLFKHTKFHKETKAGDQELQ